MVENLDIDSEVKLLQSYGPSIDAVTLLNLANSFADLRHMFESSDLSYPFSVREAVSVVKHLEAHPEEGVLPAIECVLAFDTLVPSIRKQIALVFQKHDLPVTSDPHQFNRYENTLITDEKLRDILFHKKNKLNSSNANKRV